MLLWFLPLGSYRLFNPDEGRYAEIPREMVASADWVTPRLNALKYFEKPPLQYWTTAVAYELFGQREWTARLWVALTGFLGVLLTGWIGVRLYGATAGVLAALVQAGALLYLGLARISTLDMGLTVTLELALVGLLLLVQRGRTDRGVRTGALLLALGVALAFLSKGLVGVLIPSAVATLYILLRRDWSLLWRARPWWTLSALALIAAPWVYLVSIRNPGFMQFFFVHEHFARFLSRVHQRYQPIWFFIPVLLLGFMPWTPLLPTIVRRSWRAGREGSGASLLLLIWVLFGFSFFSVSQSKLVPYILPLFPALALLAGPTLAEIEPRRLARALLISGAIWAALSGAVLFVWHSPVLRVRLDIAEGWAAPGMAAAFIVAGVLTAAAAFVAWRGAEVPRATAGAAKGGALPATALAALGSLALIGLLLPAADQLPRQRHLMNLINAAAAQLHTETKIYCVDDYEQSVPFYLRRPCTLVGYRGELEFGLTQEPTRGLADLPAFAARWRLETDALALIRTESFAALRQMGLPMRVIYTAPSLVAVVKP